MTAKTFDHAIAAASISLITWLCAWFYAVAI